MHRAARVVASLTRGRRLLHHVAPTGSTPPVGAVLSMQRALSMGRVLLLAAALSTGCAHGVAGGGNIGAGTIYVDKDADGAFASNARLGGHVTESFALMYQAALNLTLEDDLDDQLVAAHLLAGQVTLTERVWVLAGAGLGMFDPFVGDVTVGLGLSQAVGFRVGPVIPAKDNFLNWRPNGRLEIVLHATQSIPDGGVAFSLQFGVGIEPDR